MWRIIYVFGHTHKQRDKGNLIVLMGFCIHKQSPCEDVGTYLQMTVLVQSYCDVAMPGRYEAGTSIWCCRFGGRHDVAGTELNTGQHWITLNKEIRQ